MKEIFFGCGRGTVTSACDRLFFRLVSWNLWQTDERTDRLETTAKYNSQFIFIVYFLPFQPEFQWSHQNEAMGPTNINHRTDVAAASAVAVRKKFDIHFWWIISVIFMLFLFFVVFLYFYFDVIILSCFAFITATHDIPIHININTLEKMQLNSIDIQKQGVNDIPIWYLRNRSKDFVIFSSISV